jgi:hypothetical protein
VHHYGRMLLSPQRTDPCLAAPVRGVDGCRSAPAERLRLAPGCRRASGVPVPQGRRGSRLAACRLLPEQTRTELVRSAGTVCPAALEQEGLGDAGPVAGFSGFGTMAAEDRPPRHVRVAGLGATRRPADLRHVLVADDHDGRHLRGIVARPVGGGLGGVQRDPPAAAAGPAPVDGPPPERGLLVPDAAELAVGVPGRGAMAVLSIYLRQRGSPESRPVGEPHVSTDVEG